VLPRSAVVPPARLARETDLYLDQEAFQPPLPPTSTGSRLALPAPWRRSARRRAAGVKSSSQNICWHRETPHSGDAALRGRGRATSTVGESTSASMVSQPDVAMAAKHNDRFSA
jgi:hypothetical protein